MRDVAAEVALGRLTLAPVVSLTPPMSPPWTGPDGDSTDERVAELYGSFSPRVRASSLMLPTLPVVPAASVGEPIVGGCGFGAADHA